MTFPKSTVGYQDGSLGIAAAQTDGIVCVLGYSTLGTTGTLYDFNNASPTEVKATLGKGRLAQMVASLMATPNHGPVIAIPLASTAGTNSAVTSTGTTPPAVTLTGTPYDDGSGIVQIVQAGARGTATFKYSLDGGTTYSPEILTAATYLMDNGVTLNFAVGNYAADNKYTFTCVAPTHSNANITAGLDALIASGRDVGFIGILSANTGATDTDRATAMAATFAAVSTKIDALETAYRYVGCVIEAPSPVATDSSGMTAWRSALVVAGPALSSGEGRMMIAAGYCAKTSDLDALNYRRSSIFPVLERLSQAPISEDLGRVLSGALRGVTSIEHDEEATGGLDSQRYVTLRKVAGRQGFFVTQGNTFAPSGSDYSLCQYTRVINAASKTLRNKSLDYLNDSAFADNATGKIRESDALVIDADLKDALEEALAGHVSGLSVRVNRNSNFLSGGQVKVEGLIQPLLYFKDIGLSLGFSKSLPAA